MYSWFIFEDGHFVISIKGKITFFKTSVAVCIDSHMEFKQVARSAND